jgi:hypothetical protein
MQFVLDAPLRRRLDGTNGDDLVRGSRRRPALAIGPGGQLLLKGGNDRIIGIIGAPGEAGINLNRGRIGTGEGNDELVAIGGLEAWESSIGTGKGADTIIGQSNRIALDLRGSFLDTGSGDDLIDARRGTSRRHPWIGLYVTLGSVESGNGNDRIEAYGRLAGLVLDDGGLSTGKGDDVVDVRHGGLATGYAPGPLELGQGDDRFIGFAADPSPMGWGTQEPASVRGGRGTDTLVLPPGRYRIRDAAVIGARNTMMAYGFDRLEAFGGGNRPFADGTYLVGSSSITPLA